jgi:hypothetical protein
MNIVAFVWMFCYILHLTSFFLLMMCVVSAELEKTWLWGINSLICLGVLYLIASVLQWLLWRGCAIQEPPLLYLIKYMPYVILGLTGWYLGKAKKAKIKENRRDTILNLIFAYAYLTLVFLIPWVNLVLGIKFHYRQ